MFEDIIGSPKPKSDWVYKLEKNGEIIEDAIVDTSNYKETDEGYITCYGMEVTDYDCFMLLLVNEKTGNTSMKRIIVKQLSDVKFKFESESKYI